MLDQNNNYIMKDYQKKSIFYSFLPGISGEKGIPLWCHYLNRGQGIASFGVQDKDHSIMEFYPAHQAAQRTPLLGFRTFLKVDGRYKEAFSDYEIADDMVIGMNSLTIREELEEAEMMVEIEYESLPEEPVAGLLRRVTIRNMGQKNKKLELADGLAEILPYGVSSSSMKEMGQTTKAWMDVQKTESRMPVFKVRASMEDSACVTAVEGVHYGFARREDGELLPVIIDRSLLFGEDSALLVPRNFQKYDLEELLAAPQCTCNDVACCFFLEKTELKPGGEICVEELYGMAENQQILKDLEERTRKKNWFRKKRQTAKALTDQLTDRIATNTGNPVFDAYCRQTFLDNLLRGGYPTMIGNKVFYLYSRKHGDMERDYNYFSMLPEYYSQGNGNFRDVNQNRRCEPLFSPFVGERNIKQFYNALQINGYNPLKIEKVSYKLESEEFTPGELYHRLEKTVKGDDEEVPRVFESIISKSEECGNTSFGEGYWSDHWTYNLDLVENYLAVFPDEKEKLLFGDDSYTFRQAEMQLLPRSRRYEKTAAGIRQYHFLKENADTSNPESRYLKDSQRHLITVTLFEKMFCLATVKMAALDPYAMGIEMEGGKPGWYDALNGLPGLLGSSMAETYELKRLVDYLLQTVREKSGKEKKTITILTEVAELSASVVQAGKECKEELEKSSAAIDFWNRINTAKEKFWDKTGKEVSGNRATFTFVQIEELLNAYEEILKKGIQKSRSLEKNVPATYYYYEVTAFEETKEGILPTAFEVHRTPDFLEGTVHSMKLSMEKDNLKKMYMQVKKSHLYDAELGMYKVNASLADASFELGRACAFTTGWLENESVWLHMEYKYLLELMKSDLFEEFEEDFHKCAVPFLDEQVYGRSTLENSSFIASSVNPNEKIRGKGFVARLSGSTAEFLQMWQIMMFGKQPFHYEDGELTLEFTPFIPGYLIGEEKKIRAMFLGSTPVTYLLSDRESFYPGNYKRESVEVHWKTEEAAISTELKGDAAKLIRKGMAKEIFVKLGR